VRNKITIHTHTNTT